MNEFFERVVYAMLEAEADLDPMSARTVLIAALKAMREPTLGMDDASDDYCGFHGSSGAPRLVWQAMIDQAIKEGE